MRTSSNTTWFLAKHKMVMAEVLRAWLAVLGCVTWKELHTHLKGSRHSGSWHVSVVFTHCQYQMYIKLKFWKQNPTAVADEDSYSGGLLGTGSSCFQYFGQENSSWLLNKNFLIYISLFSLSAFSAIEHLNLVNVIYTAWILAFQSISCIGFDSLWNTKWWTKVLCKQHLLKILQVSVELFFWWGIYSKLTCYKILVGLYSCKWKLIWNRGKWDRSIMLDFLESSIRWIVGDKIISTFSE